MVAKKKAESFNEVKADSIKVKRLEEELSKTKREKEKIHDEFMEYKYDHMPSEIRRWLEKCYKFLTWLPTFWTKWDGFKVEFMEFCEWNCLNLVDYKKKKDAFKNGTDNSFDDLDKVLEDIELPFA